MLEIKNVTKHFFSLVAVNNVSFRLPRGEVVGILGPNGAGKTTLFKLIAGFLNPDQGVIQSANGQWPTIGFKPERLLFPNDMRVDQYMQMMAKLTHAPRQAIAASLDRVQLTSAATKKIKDCSKGMRQRLALAQILLGDPDLIVLDEPSNGLDPAGQQDILRLIQALQQMGKTILISSHQLHEVTRACTQLIILKQGRIHYQSSMAEALTLRPHVTIQATQDLSHLAPMLNTLHPSIQAHSNKVILNEEAIDLRRHVLSILLSSGLDIENVQQKRVTLEEIYAEAIR